MESTKGRDCKSEDDRGGRWQRQQKRKCSIADEKRRCEIGARPLGKAAEDRDQMNRAEGTKQPADGLHPINPNWNKGKHRTKSIYQRTNFSCRTWPEECGLNYHRRGIEIAESLYAGQPYTQQRKNRQKMIFMKKQQTFFCTWNRSHRKE